MEKLNENYKPIMLYRPYNGNQSTDWTNVGIDVEQYVGDAMAIFITGDPDGSNDADTDALLVHKLQGSLDDVVYEDICEGEPIPAGQSGLVQAKSFDITKYKFLRIKGVITGTGNTGYNPSVVVLVKLGVAGIEVENANAEGSIEVGS